VRQRRERQPKTSSYPTEQMLFAEWLRQQLRSSRLTGAELADRARISKASAYFYLDGSRIPGPTALERICAALKLDPTSVPQFERRAVGRPADRHVKAEADVC
jgi:transcriptional regulator with XRE-family HTH domain